MSRGVKDLREIICVSRLTGRSDDELSESSDISTDSLKCGTSSNYLDNDSPHFFDEGYSTLNSGRNSSDLSFQDSKDSADSKSNEKKKICTDSKRTDFDKILRFLDQDLIQELLENSCDKIDELRDWCLKGDHFLNFSHFWLSEIPGPERYKIIILEYNIFIDYLKSAFNLEQNVSSIFYKDIMEFANAVLFEYPKKFFNSRNAYFFLDYLDMMISDRAKEYRELLSKTYCTTRNKQYAQNILVLRAFALINIWSAIIDFYKSVQSSPSDSLKLQSEETSVNYWNCITEAIRYGFTDVIQYFLSTKKILPNQTDEKGRSLIFIAVMMNQEEMLPYLINKIQPKMDVNAAAHNGNTPLHAAANCGDVILVTSLLNSPDIILDPVNRSCDNATPLHLAVMYGHTYAVEVLLAAGADTKLKMGNLTAQDLAIEFQNDDIVEILKTQSSI